MNFFSSEKTSNLSQISDESKKAFDVKFNDLGKFEYEDDGFIFKIKSEQQKIKWADINRIVAYRQDLLTTDNVCIDIVFNNQRTTISEETPGWYQFVETTKHIFPSIPKNWDSRIIHPAFATDFTIIYQRHDIEIPEGNNFYAYFENTNKDKLKELFTQNGWTIRKSSWTDFEIENAWSEFSLEGDNEQPLLSGRVLFNSDYIALLNNLFDRLDCKYQYEFYDNEKNLILEKKNGS